MTAVDDLKRSFERDGFVVVRKFLPLAEFTELKDQLRRYITQVVPTLSDKYAFYVDKSRPETLKQMQHMDVDPFFRGYLIHPHWKQLAESLLGEEANAQGTEWFNKPAGTTHPTPPHQDNYYFNLVPSNVLTMWLSLEDVDEENGCLRYVRGSHRPGRRPHGRSNIVGFSQGITDFGPQDTADEVAVPLRANDLVIHHGWTIHRADANQSATRGRASFAMVFRGISCGVDEEGERRYRESLKAQHSQLGLKT